MKLLFWLWSHTISFKILYVSLSCDSLRYEHIHTIKYYENIMEIVFLYWKSNNKIFVVFKKKLNAVYLML